MSLYEWSKQFAENNTICLINIKEKIIEFGSNYKIYYFDSQLDEDITKFTKIDLIIAERIIINKIINFNKFLEENYFPTLIIKYNDEKDKNDLKKYFERYDYKIIDIANVRNYILVTENPNRLQLIIDHFDQNDLNKSLKLYQYFLKLNNNTEAKKYYDNIFSLLIKDYFDKRNDIISKLTTKYINKEALDLFDKANISYDNRNLLLGISNVFILPLNRLKHRKMKFVLSNNSNPPINFRLPIGYIESSSCLLKRDEDTFWYNIRAVNYRINQLGGYNMNDPFGHVKTKNFLLTLDKNFNILNYKQIIDQSNNIKYPTTILGLEDLRLFTPNEFFCTTLEYDRSGRPLMYYGNFDQDGKIKLLKGLSVGTDSVEKNWMPFYHNNQIHFIYSWEPFRVFKLDQNYQSIKVVEKNIEMKSKMNYDKNDPFTCDSFRGSASPIRYKDGYLCTIHQVLHTAPRKYFHRFIYFDLEMNNFKVSRLFYFNQRTIEFNLSICLGKETIKGNNEVEGIYIIHSFYDSTSEISFITEVELEKMFQ